jgi:hypothetical protein
LRCYFNLVNSHESILDQEGVEVPDLDQAHGVARAAALEMIQAGEAEAGEWSGWRMVVADDSGSMLFTIDLDKLVA